MNPIDLGNLKARMDEDEWTRLHMQEVKADDTIPKGFVKDLQTGRLMRQHVWLRKVRKGAR